jgi:transposase
MSRFPTAGHLCSWAKFSPGINSSAGKTKGNDSTGHGNRYLARVLGEAAVGIGRTDTFLGERYRRTARRRGKNRATSIWMTMSCRTLACPGNAGRGGNRF